MFTNKNIFNKRSLINHFRDYQHIPHGHDNLCTKDISYLESYIPKFNEKDALEFKTYIPNTEIEIKEKIYILKHLDPTQFAFWVNAFLEVAHSCNWSDSTAIAMLKRLLPPGEVPKDT